MSWGAGWGGEAQGRGVGHGVARLRLLEELLCRLRLIHISEPFVNRFNFPRFDRAELIYRLNVFLELAGKFNYDQNGISSWNWQKYYDNRNGIKRHEVFTRTPIIILNSSITLPLLRILDKT